MNKAYRINPATDDISYNRVDIYTQQLGIIRIDGFFECKNVETAYRRFVKIMRQVADDVAEFNDWNFTDAKGKITQTNDAWIDEDGEIIFWNNAENSFAVDVGDDTFYIYGNFTTADFDSDSDKKIAPTEADGAKLISSNKPMEDFSMKTTFDQQTRIDEAEKFFNLLFGAVKSNKFGYLWTKQDKRTHAFKVSDADARRQMARRAIELNDAGADVYFGVNLTDAPPAPTARVKKNDVTVHIATVTDIDCEGGSHISDEKKKYPTFDVAKSFLPFDVSLLVNSGYGLHGYCIYAEPIELNDDNRAIAVARNKSFINLIRSRAGQYSNIVDGVHDLPRILRVPGTFNYKIGRDNAPMCHIVEASDLRFTPAELDAKLNAATTPTELNFAKSYDGTQAAEPTADKPKGINLAAKGYDEVQATEPTADTDSDTEPCQDFLTGHKDDTEYDFFRAELMLDAIDVAILSDSDWLAVISACKNIGIPYVVVDAFNRRDSDRYDAAENQTRWDSITDTSFDIATLHGVAKRFGYDEKSARRQWYELHPEQSTRRSRAVNPTRTTASADAFDALTADVREAVTQWQSAHSDLPHIAPEMLREIGDAASYVDALTAETFTADDALNPATFRKIAVLYVFVKTRAEKYFVTLKTAQETAKSMLKSDAAEFAEPTDDTRILANLRPSDVRAEVEKLTRKVIDEQKSYARQRTWEIEAERERERIERYLKSEWTTQKVVADCPINLVIPLKVAFSMMADGTDIYIGTVTGGEKPQAFVGARTLAVPTKRLRDPAGNEAFEIAIRDEKGNWHRVEVDGRTLSDSRKILELAGKGMRIEDPTHVVKYFQRMLAANPTVIPTIRAYSQPGWYGDKFIYPVGGTDYLVRRAGFDYGAMFATRGDAEPWKNIFIRACERGGAVARIFIGTALAAALVKPLNLDNLQMHVDGTAGCGKTRLNKLAASIFGNPRRLIRTFNATRKNMLAAAAANNDLPQFFDELETVKRQRAGESFSDIIYEFAECVGNQANKRDGTAREPFFFRGARVSTAERPILQQRDQRGAWRRLVQIRADQKIFDSDFAAELDAVVTSNFGHYGRKWYEFVETHLPAIKAAHSEIVAMFKNNYKRPTEPQLFNSVIAAGFAYQIFMRCIDERSDLDNLWADATEDIEDVLEKLPTPSELDDTTRALNDLKSFVAAHEACFYHGQANQSDKPPFTANFARSEYYGKIFTNGEVAFFPTALRKILETELGYPSSDALIAEWRNKLLLKTSDGKGNRYVSWINGKSINTYRFRAEILFYKDSDSDDEQANS